MRGTNSRNPTWLRHQQRRLLAEIQDAAPSSGLTIERSPDLVEESNLREQREISASIHEVSTTKARQVRDALGRIARGEYGLAGGNTMGGHVLLMRRTEGDLLMPVIEFPVQSHDRPLTVKREADL